MTHASLFSGIGGFDLAAEWAGWTNLFNCEIDPFCRRVLKYHFPNATQYADIKTTDFTLWRGRIDILTGGFPCQPFSIAGKRKGTEDERHLWPEMLRAIREIRPRWVVGENVLGIVNWSDGMVFEQVHLDLEAEGYEVLAFVLPAAGVGANHRRYRVWFVAYRANAGAEAMRKWENGIHAFWPASDTCGIGCGKRADQSKSIPGGGGTSDACTGGKEGAAADADGKRCNKLHPATVAGQAGQFGWSLSSRATTHADDNGQSAAQIGHGVAAGNDNITPRQDKTGQFEGYTFPVTGHATNTESGRFSQRVVKQGRNRASSTVKRHRVIPNWANFPTQSSICRRNDGLSNMLDFEAVFAGCPETGRKRSVETRWRTEAIKCYGNAIVPQVVYQIFETINEFEREYVIPPLL